MHALRLCHIHAVTFHQAHHGLLAHVQTGIAAAQLFEQIDHHTLTQRAVTWAHFLHTQRVKQPHQHRQTTGQNLCALLAHGVGERPFSRLFVEHQLYQLIHAFARDRIGCVFFARTVFVQHHTQFGDGLDRAG